MPAVEQNQSMTAENGIKDCFVKLVNCDAEVLKMKQNCSNPSFLRREVVDSSLIHFSIVYENLQMNSMENLSTVTNESQV